MLVIGIADAVEEKTPDSAVIVDSEGGRLGVIGWGANCLCLYNKIQLISLHTMLSISC